MMKKEQSLDCSWKIGDCVRRANDVKIGQDQEAFLSGILLALAAGILLIVPLRSYAALTLPPLFLLTVLYLFGVAWRERCDFEQQ